MTEQASLIHKVVDSRERGDNEGIIRTKLLETGWMQKPLYFGDYMFLTGDYKKVGITRKTVDDLLNSMGDRFTKQLDEMLDEYDLPSGNRLIILIEGSWKMVNPTNNIISGHGVSYNTWTMVWNYLRRQQDKGYTIEITVNVGHTIQRLNELYALYRNPQSHSAISRDWPDDRILAFPSGCRGKTAENCLNKFGSIHRVAEATVQELMTIDKIGQKKAELIRGHFNRGEVIQDTGEIKEPKIDIVQGRIFWNESDNTSK